MEFLLGYSVMQINQPLLYVLPALCCYLLSEQQSATAEEGKERIEQHSSDRKQAQLPRSPRNNLEYGLKTALKPLNAANPSGRLFRNIQGCVI